MKKLGLLKKICSAFVTVSMLASLGTVAFASNPGAYIPDDNSVKITDITCVANSTIAGLYNVTVTCEVSDGAMDRNAIGVTMLTYAKKNKSLVATESGYDAYDDTTMQIVGIDQKQREDGANTVEFSFAVTTDDKEGANAYAVQPGKSAVILVSGDGLNPAAGLLTIEKIKEAKTAASATVSYGSSMNVYSYDTEATVLARLKDTFSSAPAEIADGEGNVIGTTVVDVEYVKNAVKKDDTTFEVTAVIPATASVDSEDYNVTIPAAGLTVTFDFVVIPTAWEADTIAYTFETEQNIAVSAAIDEDAIKNLFVGKNVSVSAAGNDLAKATVTITPDMIVADSANPTDIAVGNVYNYTITIPDTVDYIVTAADKDIAVKVTIVEDPTEPFDITKVVLDGTVPSSYTGLEGESEDDIAAKVVEDLTANTSLKATVKGANGEIETWAINESTWAYDKANKVFTAEIVKVDDALLGVNANNLKVEVRIELIVVAPAYVLGDVNGDGRYNAADALLAIRMGLPAAHTNHYAATDAEKLAADVNGDGRQNAADALLIIRRGLPAVHPNALTKFPVENN